MGRKASLCLSCAWFGACLLAATFGRADEHGTSPTPSQRNLLENGGFETWRKLDTNTLQQAEIAGLRLEPAGSTPAGWLPCRETFKDQKPTATLALDEKVKHSGERSVRIENRDMRDITYARYSTEPFAAGSQDPRNIRPNRRYAIRWWVRGQKIDPAGTGPILMMHIASTKEGKTYGTPTSEEANLPKGTFDWQPREFTFITDPYARWFTFTLQLRWTTGTVWYDDVELVDLGAVVNVETY
jgi:hypothetical protein